MPSPQPSLRQVALQRSPETLFPSSHCSGASTTRLPHTVSRRQVALQPSPLAVLPSSHCSASPLWVVPSPQRSVRQVELQPSPLSRLPSSHCSVPSFLLSPHTVSIWQRLL